MKYKRCVSYFLLFSLYLYIYLSTSYIFYNRIGVFGCGDECINYTAGYFLHQGKQLYSEIFFNRQPSLAYISAAIQWVLHPTSLYQLVLYHRMSVIAYAFIFGMLLIWRLRLSGVLFLLLYEGTKYYSYGYQFIGEAFIVYPLVYMTGLVWESWKSNRIFLIDLYMVAFLSAFVFWTREPYIPLALSMFGVYIWQYRGNRLIHRMIAVFVLLVVTPYIVTPLGEYVRQVITVNVPAAGAGIGINQLVYSVFYPLILLIRGSWTLLRQVEIGLVLFMVIGIYIWLRETKKLFPILCVFGFLGLAGIRTVLPGTMFYEAFHMLPWFGMAIMVTALLLTSIRNPVLRMYCVSAFVLFSLSMFAVPRSFIWEKVDRQAEFTNQYAKYTQYSSAIKIIIKPSQTIFLDMWDDVIYWESGRPSSYPYSLYIPMAANFSPYKEARVEMFRRTPPDVYYSCPKMQNAVSMLPVFSVPEYVQFYTGDQPSCLYIKKQIVQSLTQDQILRMVRLGFVLP